MGDLVERLRERGGDYMARLSGDTLCDEAADEIERLQAILKAKLHQTADGAWVAENDTVYHPGYSIGLRCRGSNAIVEHAYGIPSVSIHLCYSTREAAEKAREK